MKISIIYKRLYDFDSGQYYIGGVETYLTNLMRILTDIGWECRFYQESKDDHRKTVDYGEIIGVKVSQKSEVMRKKAVFQKLLGEFHHDTDVLLFGADHYSVKTSIKKSIAIQHGIGWDLPVKYLTSNRLANTRFGRLLKKIQVNYHGYLNSHRATFLVCVDYNYINWYRTMYPDIVTKNYTVIPNFARVIASPESIKTKLARGNNTSLLFARRFVEYRGTRLLSAVIKRLYDEGYDFTVTFAGDGPDETRLRKTFMNYSNVKFIRYSSDDSHEVHLSHDMCIVPSIASEGTSISLAEGMAAGCIPIATNIGGMTNMIINGYNGYLCDPKEESLYSIIKYNLIHRNSEIAQNAYETARSSFSFESWRKQWEAFVAPLSK